MDTKRLLVDEIAEYLGVSRDTDYRWIEGRRFPADKVGRSWKSKVAEIDDWVKSGRGAEIRLIEEEGVQD